MRRSADPGRVEVRIAPQVWEQEVERFRRGSPARIAAERERRRLERDGLARADYSRCRPNAGDGTRLTGMVKVKVPLSKESVSERPFGFVLAPGIHRGGVHLALVAFGERHPQQQGTRSVYERAHKMMHGRFPDQERGRGTSIQRSPRTHSPSRGVGRPSIARGLDR